MLLSDVYPALVEGLAKSGMQCEIAAVLLPNSSRIPSISRVVKPKNASAIASRKFEFVNDAVSAVDRKYAERSGDDHGVSVSIRVCRMVSQDRRNYHCAVLVRLI